MVSFLAKCATHIDKGTPVRQYAKQILQIHRAALFFGRRPSKSLRLQDMQGFHMRRPRNAVLLGKAHDNHCRLLYAYIEGIHNSVTELWTLQQQKTYLEARRYDMTSSRPSQAAVYHTVSHIQI